MHHISFNEAMLIALRAGRKTVTRRRLSSQCIVQADPNSFRYDGLTSQGALFEQYEAADVHTVTIPCPYGLPGEYLQVAEAPGVTLRICQIRAEQVRSISEAEILAEGIDQREPAGQLQWGGVEPDAAQPGEQRWFSSSKAAFQSLLNSIYPHAWARNE